MNGLPYYKAYPRDFIEGAIGMSFEVKCAYRVLIDLIYMQGGQLPDDARYISGHLGCSLRKWKSIRDELIGLDKIQVSSGFLSNYRADKELETLSKLQEKQAENRRGYKKNNDLQEPPLNHTEPEPEPYIDTNVSIIENARVSKKSDAVEIFETLGQWASHEAVTSFIAYRKRTKSKALTLTAARRLATNLKEIFNAGGDTDDALGMAEERGWQTVKPEWYFNTQRGRAGQGSGMAQAFAAVAAREASKQRGC